MIAFATPLLGPSPSTGPAPRPSCLSDSDICHYVYRWTDNVWLAESSYWALVKPLRILVIVLVAVAVRFLVHRAITRLTTHATQRAGRSLRGPLRQRIPGALRAATALPTVVPAERRRQRAAALASVLRSVASAMILTVSAMLIISELGYDLAPILASAGIVGVAVGFGAQNLVKDFLAGMFILLEDQFGVGDTVELGQPAGTVTGTVEAVGLRISTVRDELGALWYIRNGEILRVGNRSQGWALAIVDIPVALASATKASDTLRAAAASLAADPEWADALVDPPEVLGIEEVTAATTVLRTTVRTTVEAQARVTRELRLRLAAALLASGSCAEAPAAAIAGETTPAGGRNAATSVDELRVPTQEPPAAGPRRTVETAITTANRPHTRDTPA